MLFSPNNSLGSTGDSIEEELSSVVAATIYPKGSRHDRRFPVRFSGVGVDSGDGFLVARTTAGEFRGNPVGVRGGRANFNESTITLAKSYVIKDLP